MLSPVLPSSCWPQSRDEADEYIWCRHVKRYLRWQFSNCEIQELLDALGALNYERLEHSLSNWLDLRKPIPRAFTTAIRANIDLLNTILEIDQKEYDRTLLYPVAPKLFWTEDANGGQIPQPLPCDGTVAGSVAHIEEYLRDRPEETAYLHWPHLRTILFQNGRATITLEYRPRFRYDHDHYSFGNDGSTLPTAKS